MQNDVPPVGPGWKFPRRFGPVSGPHINSHSAKVSWNVDSKQYRFDVTKGSNLLAEVCRVSHVPRYPQNGMTFRTVLEMGEKIFGIRTATHRLYPCHSYPTRTNRHWKMESQKSKPFDLLCTLSDEAPKGSVQKYFI